MGLWVSLSLPRVMASAILDHIFDLLPGFRLSQCYFDATILSLFNPLYTTPLYHFWLPMFSLL
ncbi:MAG: hypothetical protein OXH63_10370 [Gemmatimonadetes bacterium]|nr:hypothetical protein [Gemmatimonadota bacterium]